LPKGIGMSKSGRQGPKTETVLTGKSVSEREALDSAKAALGALRSSETPLGVLTSEEESWLATAFSHLNQIYENRELGGPGDNPFCVCEVGNVFVQFLAPEGEETLLCEAVSAKFVPEVAAILTEGGEGTLLKLGFEAPGASPNYSQTIKIEGVADLAYAARLGLRVLKQAYRITDFSAASFKIEIPRRLKKVLTLFLNEVNWKDAIEHDNDRNTDFVSVGYAIDGQSYRLVLIADERFTSLAVLLTSPIRIPKPRAKEATFLLNFLNGHMRCGHLEMGGNGEVLFNWVIDVGGGAAPCQFHRLVSAASYAFDEKSSTAIGAAAFSKQSAEEIIEDLKAAWKTADEKADEVPSTL
jgi:hypothetical protein